MGGRLCSSDQRLYHSITPANGINDRQPGCQWGYGCRFEEALEG